MNALEIKNLAKTFPGFRLDVLTLTLPTGCIMGLIGENAAGKSTTIRLIQEMLRPDSGRSSAGNADPGSHRRIRPVLVAVHSVL